MDAAEGECAMELFDLSGKTIFITGGTRGIGLAVAKGMQAAGGNVWIHGSDEGRTKEIARQHQFRYVSGDLRSQDWLDEMLRPIYEQESKLDVLVNNAGYESSALVEEGRTEELDCVYQVNAKSPYAILQKLLPLLKQANGASVINVTSIHQTVPVRGNGHYCMAKASLAMFTKVAALELAKDRIRVNNLAPGAILTDMNRELVQSMAFEQWIPMGRVGMAEELIGPAIFLASGASSYVTGTTLYVDGGYSENLLRY